MRPETYEKMRLDADYEKTNEHILHFLELRKRRLSSSRSSSCRSSRWSRRWAKWRSSSVWSVPGVDQINVKPFDSWGDQLEDINACAPGRNRNCRQRYPCPNLWYHTHIYWDGRWSCCDRDFNLAYDLGNVRSSDGVVRVLENWNGPKMQELRRRHVRGEYDSVTPCNTCTEWAWWKPSPFKSQGNYNAAKLEGKEDQPSQTPDIA